MKDSKRILSYSNAFDNLCSKVCKDTYVMRYPVKSGEKIKLIKEKKISC